jgi:hypothetical protein
MRGKSDGCALMSPHVPHFVGNEDAEEKKRAGNADEGQEKIKRFLRPRIIRFSDRANIDQEAEAQSEEETERFKHAAMISHHEYACQPRNSTGSRPGANPGQNRLHGCGKGSISAPAVTRPIRIRRKISIAGATHSKNEAGFVFHQDFLFDSMPTLN